MTEQYCTFFVGDMYMGIAVRDVEEVLAYQPMTPVPLAPSVIEGLINLRGRIVTAIDLRLRLGLPARPPEHRPMNVVVSSRDEAISLLVDRIGDVIETHDNAIEAPPQTVQPSRRELIRGVYKLDNQLMLILDTDKALDIQSS